ncbi:hypothetical protein FVE85_4217 [Porphyridium purpureum]|uniref:Integrase catalytic domain-containing protein n=1 Tax=Porphyridium purpureum TaxID=35688 RepID=A0A5J4YTS6_PORPP|nr:hypothetical protein FVE85_4217 [Porphyridium purpureum]|eukprot:POR9536..scf229_5
MPPLTGPDQSSRPRCEYFWVRRILRSPSLAAPVHCSTELRLAVWKDLPTAPTTLAPLGAARLAPFVFPTIRTIVQERLPIDAYNANTVAGWVTLSTLAGAGACRQTKHVPSLDSRTINMMMLSRRLKASCRLHAVPSKALMVATMMRTKPTRQVFTWPDGVRAVPPFTRSQMHCPMSHARTVSWSIAARHVHALVSAPTAHIDKHVENPSTWHLRAILSQSFGAPRILFREAAPFVLRSVPTISYNSPSQWSPRRCQSSSEPTSSSHSNFKSSTVKELDTMHKRFGHASAPQMLKLLRLAGEPLDAVQRRELEERIAQCSTCQWYRGNRSTFKIAADVEVSFNHTVSMDFVFLETHKTLHAVCNGTKFQMAMFCGEDATATGVYRIFFNNWIAIVGAPHRVVVDKERVTVSHDLRVLLEAECCALVDIPVEAHWSLGQVERYHEPLRKVFLRVAREAPDLTAHDQLAITVRALNVTCGPEGIIPALLVFGTVPRMQLRPEVAQHDHMETQAGRIAAIFAARNEFEKWISARKLAQARRSRAPSYPNAAPGHEITPGTAVLVRRESAYEWQGPYIALKVDAPRVTVVLPSTVSAARARQQEFHINNVKVYRLETPATLFVDTPASVQDLYKTFPQASATSNASWDDADLLELNGIINRQVLEPCPDLPAMANVIGSRMKWVRQIKWSV